ncbi:pleiotropic drug resistance abc transporter [Moniliophthora roreri]|nr:pleiotropic drug resistance abc transporter [Moniliophthora roreri]
MFLISTIIQRSVDSMRKDGKDEMLACKLLKENDCKIRKLGSIFEDLRVIERGASARRPTVGTLFKLSMSKYNASLPSRNIITDFGVVKLGEMFLCGQTPRSEKNCLIIRGWTSFAVGIPSSNRLELLKLCGRDVRASVNCGNLKRAVVTVKLATPNASPLPAVVLNSSGTQAPPFL